MASAVAGIVDSKGGLRVVVTQRWRMRYHVGKKERLFVVPDLRVREPVPPNDIPPLVTKVQEYVAKTLAPTNHCGECRQCCKTLYIEAPEFKKPSHQWCHNCGAKGCKVYWNRPTVCRQFECIWLKSQKRNDVMAAELRPDKCGVIFIEDSQDNDPLIIEVHGEPNASAWRWINSMQAVGYKAKKVTHYIGEKK